MAKTVVAIRLDPADIDALHAGAKHRGHTPSEWIRMILSNQAEVDRQSGKAPKRAEEPKPKRGGVQQCRTSKAGKNRTSITG